MEYMHKKSILKSQVSHFSMFSWPYLQIFALALVAGYNYLPAVNSFCLNISTLKTDHGYLFSGLSTALFGGIIPFAVLALTRKTDSSRLISHGLFFFIFWFYKGMEVDLLYRCQAVMFGDETTASVIVKKVMFDQFVYNMFYAAGMMTLCYLRMVINNSGVKRLQISSGTYIFMGKP